MQIMTLNDGETWSDLAGCAIYEVPDGIDAEKVEDQLASEAAHLVRSFNATERPTRAELSQAASLLREFASTSLESGATNGALALAGRLEGRA